MHFCGILNFGKTENSLESVKHLRSKEGLSLNIFVCSRESVASVRYFLDALALSHALA